ncbi:MAG TPA: hypothetical protein VGW38_17295 [Chloroflexota bacterium]|nr:hypothetical protein [Chloroflexota bacterium]
MPRPEQGPLPYQRASRFPGEGPAGRAYTAAQRVIYDAPGSDVSVFRLQVNQLWYVAALGLVPPAPVLQALERILDTGEQADLPTDVWDALHERRRQATRLGPWVERHWRPDPPGERPARD